MAQHKYDLLTVPTEPRGPPRHHPWYKERLKLKYTRSSKPSSALDGERWTFLSRDLDDFRTGVPHPATAGGQGLIKKGQMKLVPLIDSHSTETLLQAKKPRPPPPARLHDTRGARTVYSRVGPRRQAQMERLSREEAGLVKHPLGLYPHLEESVPPEMLEDIVNILDPELRLSGSESELSSSSSDSLSTPEQKTVPAQDEDKYEGEGEGGEETVTPQQTDIYRWPLCHSEEEEEERRERPVSQGPSSGGQNPPEVDRVTEDLVCWADNLGGSSNSVIDEATIKKLFASDYESNPLVTAPIRVVELAHIPTELRSESRGQSAYSHSSRYGRWTATTPFPEEPRRIKPKYGAWYLPKKLWKLRPENEPLCNPREEKVEEQEAIQKSLDTEQRLHELHGAVAFKHFITTQRPGSNMPKFLRSVGVGRLQGKRPLLKGRTHTL